MADRKKLQSYIGFSLRSRKIVLGVNAVEGNRKPVYALLMCKSAAKNTVKAAHNIAARLGVRLYEVDDLAALVNKENCKLCALTDKSLGAAVAAQLETEAPAEKDPAADGGKHIE